ncbi:hypothetical protein [uncultured Veillonella sp.]|uniref:hypothetical protein n=1 Tax=uncultured Veillonella sp. TaxID=159268 RepID=UPI0028D476B4|nr:hypothetical protein [uncultured Veillonella sp.]
MISELLKFIGINSSDNDITKESKLKSEDNRTESNIAKERQNQPVEIEFWDIEPEDVPELEESDIPGVYFNEFREYVDEEGHILSPSDLDAIRYKDDYEDDYYR